MADWSHLSSNLSDLLSIVEDLLDEVQGDNRHSTGLRDTAMRGMLETVIG